MDDEDLVRAYDAVILMGPYLRADVTAEERATITADIVACVARPLRRMLATRGIVQRVGRPDRTPAAVPEMEKSTGEMACSGPSDTGVPTDVKSRDPFSSPDHLPRRERIAMLLYDIHRLTNPGESAWDRMAEAVLVLERYDEHSTHAPPPTTTPYSASADAPCADPHAY